MVSVCRREPCQAAVLGFRLRGWCSQAGRRRGVGVQGVSAPAWPTLTHLSCSSPSACFTLLVRGCGVAFGLPCVGVTWETGEALPRPVQPVVSVQAALPRGAPLPLLVWERNFLVQLVVKPLTPTQVPTVPRPFVSSLRGSPAFGTGGGPRASRCHFVLVAACRCLSRKRDDLTPAPCANG